MKHLNIFEIDEVLDAMQPLVGSELQNVQLVGDSLTLVFWGDESSRGLCFDMSLKGLGLYYLPNLGKRPSKASVKPILLFAKAQLVGMKLTRLERLKDYGRVVELGFSSEDKVASLRFISIPHGQNLSVVSGQKSISWNKPKDLEKVDDSSYQPEVIRSYEEIFSEWQQLGQNKPKKEKENDFPSAIKKTKKNIEKVKKDFLSKEDLWLEAYQYVVDEQSLDVPDKYKELINNKEDVSWNLQNLFKLSKKFLDKQEKLKERIQQLEEELKSLESGVWPKNKPKSKKDVSRLKSQGLKGKSLRVDEGTQVYIGKSAKENIELLKKSKPWDPWFHLKDYPGSYAIVSRPRKKTLSEKEIGLICQWVIKMSFGQKYKQKEGDSFDVLVAECRYIKPIKGDKLGRVNYRNEAVHRVKFDSAAAQITY